MCIRDSSESARSKTPTPLPPPGVLKKIGRKNITAHKIKLLQSTAEPLRDMPSQREPKQRSGRQKCKAKETTRSGVWAGAVGSSRKTASAFRCGSGWRSGIGESTARNLVLEEDRLKQQTVMVPRVSLQTYPLEMSNHDSKRETLQGPL